jgi:hypothetical protein
MKLKKLIGKGWNRNVYEHPEDPELVVKVVTHLHEGIDSNKLEWEIWNKIKDTKHAEYFCPCVDLTQDGHLIMQKCEKTKEKNEEKIYVLGFYVRDSKRSGNKGLLNNKMVIIDYGHPKNVKFLAWLDEKL